MRYYLNEDLINDLSLLLDDKIDKIKTINYDTATERVVSMLIKKQ